MHIQLSQALGDGMDTPGQRVMRASVARDPQPLATACDSHGKKDADASARACASL